MIITDLLNSNGMLQVFKGLFHFTNLHWHSTHAEMRAKCVERHSWYNIFIVVMNTLTCRLPITMFNRVCTILKVKALQVCSNTHVFLISYINFNSCNLVMLSTLQDDFTPKKMFTSYIVHHHSGILTRYAITFFISIRLTYANSVCYNLFCEPQIYINNCMQQQKQLHSQFSHSTKSIKWNTNLMLWRMVDELPPVNCHHDRSSNKIRSH